jgi:hypothetical protein
LSVGTEQNHGKPQLLKAKCGALLLMKQNWQPLHCSGHSVTVFGEHMGCKEVKLHTCGIEDM